LKRKFVTNFTTSATAYSEHVDLPLESIHFCKVSEFLLKEANVLGRKQKQHKDKKFYTRPIVLDLKWSRTCKTSDSNLCVSGFWPDSTKALTRFWFDSKNDTYSDSSRYQNACDTTC